MAVATSFDRDVLAPLRHRPDSVWVRDGLALFGWGARIRIDPGVGPDRYQRTREIAADEKSVVFASFTFDEDQPGSVVLVPEIILEMDGHGHRFLSGDESSLPGDLEMDDLPRSGARRLDRDSWRLGVDTVMERIAEGEVEKVVLSRAVDIEFEDVIPIHTIVENLAAAQPLSHTYLVEGLVGSSPELLVQLQSGDIRSVSLAGSADRSMPGSIESLTTPKNTTEHALAAESVATALARHSTELVRRETEIATYGNIHHLATVFTGMAIRNTAVTDLLGSLHPTAAVAGTPTEKAVMMIKEIEDHDRGRYAGPVGWVDGSGDGEFAIALRCGLIAGTAVRLFSGAGLVEGSEPDAEFEETELKLEPMLLALGLG